MTPELLSAIERLIKEESLGADAAKEFAEVRAIAIRWMAGHKNDPPDRPPGVHFSGNRVFRPQSSAASNTLFCFKARREQTLRPMPRPCIVPGLCRCLLLVSAVAFAQSPETGLVERNGSQASLIVDSARPLDSAAITIAEQFGFPLNCEDPPYAYKDDVKDVTADAWRRLHPSKLALIPKGGRLEIQFASRPDGSPEDSHGLLQRLVDKANELFPFRYRLDVAGGSFSLVPTHTRDLLGHVVEITPLLDRRITIPLANRTVAETVNLMTAQLSAQTGLHVSCCRGVVAGTPWGMTRTDLSAKQARAQRLEAAHRERVARMANCVLLAAVLRSASVAVVRYQSHVPKPPHRRESRAGRRSTSASNDCLGKPSES